MGDELGREHGETTKMRLLTPDGSFDLRRDTLPNIFDFGINLEKTLCPSKAPAFKRHPQHLPRVWDSETENNNNTGEPSGSPIKAHGRRYYIRFVWYGHSLNFYLTASDRYLGFRRSRLYRLSILQGFAAYGIQRQTLNPVFVAATVAGLCSDGGTDG